MAQSDEEIQLRGKARRRLVGAVGLVLVAAVVLPLVLDSKPKPMNQDIAIDIPKPSDTGLNTAAPAKPPLAGTPVTSPAAPVTPPVETVPNTPDIPPAKPAPVVAAAAPAKPAAEKPASAKPADKPADKPAAKPAPKADEKPAAKPEKPAAKPVPEKPVAKPTPEKPAKPADKPAEKAADKPKSGAFVVQVAALSNADNAKQLQSKLAAGGVKAYTDTVKGANGTLTRVRVGPYASHEEADKALAKVKQLGVDGKVVPK